MGFRWISSYKANLQKDRTLMARSSTLFYTYMLHVMEYLPTFAQHKSPSFVGKYTSTMEHMGNRNQFFIELDDGKIYTKTRSI